MKHLFYTFLLLCFSATALIAQNPVSWTWKAKHLQDNDFEITFKAKINDGWYTYSQFLESDDGPIKTTVEFESANEEKAGKASETTSKPTNKIAGHDKMFDMNIIKYKKDLTITQKIKVKDINKKVTGYLEFMTCDDTQCMPPSAVEFEFKPMDLMQKAVPVEQPKEEEEKKEPKEKPADNNSNKGSASTDINTTTVATTETDETPVGEPKPNTASATPVTWDVTFNKINDNEVDLVAKATISDGWYVYSQTLEGDDGPVPTAVFFSDSSGLEFVSNTETTSNPSYKLEGIDKMFDMNITKYKHDFTITQRLKVTDNNKEIKGFLEFMTCDDTQCMPPSGVDFAYSLNGTATTEGTVVGDKFNPVRSTLVATNEKPYGSCDGETGSNINSDSQVSTMSWLAIFLAGFGGGLIALLTPCVFPMIPMTVSLFSKKKKKGDKEEAEKKDFTGIKNALIFGASIIVIYVSLGLLVTGVFGADALNQLSTSWIMNLIFFALFTIFAISFFGYFDISLPASWVNKVDEASDREGLLGAFFGAFSICLVSFSCTGPIVGSLLVEAVKTGYGGPAIGMLGFSIALALPFTLFAIFPSWLQSLPRSGGWMTTMKVVLGFVELALGLKFLSVADLTQHWGILPYEAFIALWAIIFAAMALYLFGFIRFPHDDRSAKIGLPRKVFGGLTAIFALYVLSGFMTNTDDTFVTPSLLSGLAPPVCYSYIKPCDCPATLDECFHDYDEALAHAKKVNKPLLIDFTGHGCVNCRKMEDQVWTKKPVNDLIRNEYVLVSLYVDDREKLPQTLVGPDGRKIRNVGNKWALFQEVNFQKQSQPYYVLVNGKEQVLNTPRAYTPDVDTYKGFLQCGIDQYKKSMQE